MTYFDAESLRPAIRAILAGADQSQITARQVRKMLVQNDASLDPDVLAEHKEEINHITKSVFEALTAISPSPSASPSPPPPSTSTKPHSNSHHSFPQHQPSHQPVASTSSSKPSKSSSHKVKSESGSNSHTLSTDAEYAQSLSLSLNSHSTRGPSASSSSRTKSSKSKKSTDEKKKRKRVQSSPTVAASDSDEEEGKKQVKKVKKVKKEGGGGDGEEDGEKKVRGGAFNKEMGLSEALQAVVGGDRMSRPQTVKKIWEYVKERDLQDASDKRYIICDDTLQAVFKVPKVHMFTMNKLLSKHIYPLDE